MSAANRAQRIVPSLPYPGQAVLPVAQAERRVLAFRPGPGKALAAVLLPTTMEMLWAQVAHLAQVVMVILLLMAIYYSSHSLVDRVVVVGREQGYLVQEVLVVRVVALSSLPPRPV